MSRGSTKFCSGTSVAMVQVKGEPSGVNGSEAGGGGSSCCEAASSMIAQQTRKRLFAHTEKSGLPRGGSARDLTREVALS